MEAPGRGRLVCSRNCSAQQGDEGTWARCGRPSVGLFCPSEHTRSHRAPEEYLSWTSFSRIMTAM